MIIDVREEITLYDFLKKEFSDKSKNNVKVLLKNGLYVNDKYVTKYDYVLKKGDKLRLILKKFGDIELIYEDNDFLVVNKPSGILTVATLKEKNKTVYHILLEYLKKKKQKIFILHRLDRDTSGIIVFCKNEKLRDMLQENWKKVTRKYLAIVNGRLEEKQGTYKDYLMENKIHKVYISKKGGELAITDYKVIKERKNYSLVEINIKTGKKNQIRVQMAEHGNYILGDNKYSGDYKNYKRLFLHASYISFVHPITNRKMVFELAMPAIFKRIIK